MRRRLQIVAVLLVLVLTLVAAGSAFATPRPCMEPPGQHVGWVRCSPCCENPRGKHLGWEPCGCGCCENPRGQIRGWEPCD